jgi:ATP-binding cassette subfamily C protein
MTPADGVRATTEALPIAGGRRVLREVGAVIGRRPWRLGLLIVVLVAAAAAGIVPPLALGAVVDVVAAGDADLSRVWMLGAAMAVAVVAGSVLGAVGMVAASGMFERMLAELRERMVESAFRLPQARVERAGTGDVIARAGDDVAEVSGAIPTVVPALVGALFAIVVTLVGMVALDIWYAVALLVLIPIHVFAVRGYLRTAPGVYAAERAAMATRAQRLLDSLRGIDSVRAYGLAQPHREGIAAASWSVVRWSMRARMIQNVFFGRLNVAEFVGMAGLLIVGFVLVSTGAGTIGGTTAAMLLFLRLFGPINQLLFVVDELQSAFASLGRIVGVISMERDPQSIPAARPAAPGGSLRIASLGHSYVPGHPVLSDIDLWVRPGERVAVVGASGAGKTTLAALVAGVHDAETGHVEAAGPVMLVTQEVHVFDATLRENLSWAAPAADDTRLTDALTRVGGERLLRRLGGGLDEPLGASGASLTPAEAQQIALARVLLADPAIVVLDEATAEAGSSEAGLLESAAVEATRGRTALIVAHRLNQAAAADRVVLMERGRIIEQGKHDDLVAAGGSYARLWNAWSGGRAAR